MDIELDIDGLHSALEASPNDQRTLETLVSFYRAEGAFEELTELYLGQLENQTEDRLPLYRGLAEVMEKHLALPEDARVVVLEGLQEFPTDKLLWSQLRDLSETEEHLLEYVAMLKESGLNQESPNLLPELILLVGELSEDEITQLFQKVQQNTLQTRDEEMVVNLWHELNEQFPQRRFTYLPSMLDVAIELESIQALELVGADIGEMHDDFIAQFIAAIRNLTIANSDAKVALTLKPALTSNKKETKALAFSAVMEIAEALNDYEFLDKVDIGDEAVSDELFEQFMRLTCNRCIAQEELSPLLEYLPISQTWTQVRRELLHSSLLPLAVERGELDPLLELSSNHEGMSHSVVQQLQLSVKKLCTEALSELQFDNLLNAIQPWDHSVKTELLETLCLKSGVNENIRTRSEKWLFEHATNDALNAFVEKYIATSDDFDAISALMKRRAQVCDARQESAETERHWRQRALSLNPSSTGVFDYFENERVLEEADLIFLENLVSQEQTDPRVALRIALKAMAFERRIEHADSWNDLLILAYRRSKTYDGDHQEAIAFLKKDEQYESVALLLKESATIETDPMIRRTLLLDAGDIILNVDPKAAARFYYRAFETKNDDRVILSKLLDAYQKSEEWAKSSKVLKKLASLASDGILKAKYLYAMGVIERDKLSDHIAAVRAFDKALDADPTLVKAIQAIDEVITNDKDYERQDRYYRKCLTRAINHGIDSRVIFQLAQNLATLNLNKFSNDDAAIQALKVARAHALKTSDIDKQLLAIYRSKGELNHALDIHYNGLNEAPLKILHYKELFVTLRSFGLNQSASLVQNTLAALGHAESNQPTPSRDGRAQDMPHFTQAMWKMLTPTSMRTILTEVFNLLAPAIIQTYALEDNAYRFSRPEPLGPSTIPSVFMAVASRLRLPLPMVWFSTESAPIAQVHRTTPALVLGPGIDKLTAVEQKFMAARMLFKSKPGFFLATHPSNFQERVSHLKALFNGCLQLTKTGKFDFRDMPLVRSTLSALETKDVLGLTQMLSDVPPVTDADIEDWIRSIDLMASRIGFVLVTEAEAPIRLLRDTSQSCSDLSSSDRITDLLQFSVSKDYLSICGDLGQPLN